MHPVVRKDWDWAVTGKGNRERRILTSIYLDPPLEEKANYRMLKTWQTIQQDEVRYKEYFTDDAEFVIVGFGTAGRVALSAVRAARQMGLKVGLFRPVTVSPFPYDELGKIASKASAFLVVEMNQGQMLNDVQLAVKGRIPVEFYGRPGGMVPFPDEILREIKRMTTTKLSIATDPRVAWLQRTLA
jgi:2-oxoglutarate ferredoxin oxidoreductase subunit alpha